MFAVKKEMKSDLAESNRVLEFERAEREFRDKMAKKFAPPGLSEEELFDYALMLSMQISPYPRPSTSNAIPPLFDLGVPYSPTASATSPISMIPFAENFAHTDSFSPPPPPISEEMYPPLSRSAPGAGLLRSPRPPIQPPPVATVQSPLADRGGNPFALPGAFRSQQPAGIFSSQQPAGTFPSQQSAGIFPSQQPGTIVALQSGNIVAVQPGGISAQFNALSSPSGNVSGGPAAASSSSSTSSSSQVAPIEISSPSKHPMASQTKRRSSQKESAESFGRKSTTSNGSSKGSTPSRARKMSFSEFMASEGGSSQTTDRRADAGSPMVVDTPPVFPIGGASLGSTTGSRRSWSHHRSSVEHQHSDDDDDDDGHYRHRNAYAESDEDDEEDDDDDALFKDLSSPRALGTSFGSNHGPHRFVAAPSSMSAGRSSSSSVDRSSGAYAAPLATSSHATPVQRRPQPSTPGSAAGAAAAAGGATTTNSTTTASGASAAVKPAPRRPSDFDDDELQYVLELSMVEK